MVAGDIPTPCFSVVIPTYNRADLLHATLESVFCQRSRDFEVIVVDDGSTEDQSAVIEEYRDRVRFLRQQNAGPSAARNLGAASAVGEYLAFLDSDDVWFPWTLDVYSDAAIEHKRPAFIAGCPYEFSDPKELDHKECGPIEMLAYTDYLRSGDEWRWFGVSSFVIRRDAFLECKGFCSEMRSAEDADLALRLGTANGFVQVVSPCTFGYRQGSVEQLTADWRPQLPAARRLLANERELAYPGAQDRAVERQRIISRHIRPVAIALLQNGKALDAWHLYWNLLRWNVRLGKWKFILGFPVISVWKRLFGRRAQVARR